MSVETHVPTFAAQSRLLSVKETTALLKIGPRMLWKYSFLKDSSRRIPSYKIGKLRRYKYDEVMHWLENCKS